MIRRYPIASVQTSAHTHPESEVVNLTGDLAAKAASAHTHSESNVTNLITDLAAKAASVHTHAESDVTSLVTDLAGKSSTSHTHPGLGNTTPADQNLLAWSFDPSAVTSGSLTTNGVLYLVRLIPRDGTATKIYWYVTNSAVTATAGQNEVGIFNSSGTRLASTNVDSVITAAGLKQTTISDQTISGSPMLWAAFVFNAATPPTLARSTTVSSGTLTNVGLTTAVYRYATNGTGRTAIPSSITPSSNALLDFAPWVALG
jgi:hypothetical protein